jgi:hypothetical protein
MTSRWSVVVAAIVLLGTACGGNSEPSASEVSSGDRGGDESPAPEDEAGTFRFEVWFEKDDFLYLVTREAPDTPTVAQTAIESLLEGPSDGEGDNVTTAIPSGTELLGVTVDRGLATVDLSGSFDDGGGSAGMMTRLGQVVFTLTQFPTVDAVNFKIDGEPVDVFSAEGIVLDEPQTRGHYEELAPPIIVTSPEAAEDVSSPVSVQGTANVFEATVSIRILDADGKKIADTFTTATCGTGCRGDYSEAVAFDVADRQEGVIEVFEASAEDGSPLHMVRIPVTLVP